MSNKFFKLFRRGGKKESQPVEPEVQPSPQPAVHELQPVVQEPQPVVQEPQPDHEELQPVSKELQPFIEELQPAAHEPQPAVQEVQPSIEELQPSIEEPQPSIEEPQPVEQELLPVEQTTQPLAEPEPPLEAAQAPAVIEQDKPAAKSGFFARIRAGLTRTSNNFAEGLGNLFLGKKEIDDELLEDIETQLLIADVGVDATTEIIDSLTDRVARKQLANADALYEALRASLAELLVKVESPLVLPEKAPAVILVVGVNGVGKTTTIGKLAKRLQNEGKSVLLAAGDTFRAAAVEQLQVWGERNNVPVVAQHTGADSASVIFDAIAAAKARGVDVVIADTAGRLHNKSHLMEELAKVKRVMAKLDATAPHEVLLVLDAGTGQNALNQAEQFIAAAGVTGIALTKLDGTAKGGVIFALSQKFGLPVRFIGVGEGIDDLQPFEAKAFVQALFNEAG